MYHSDDKIVWHFLNDEQTKHTYYSFTPIVGWHDWLILILIIIDLRELSYFIPLNSLKHGKMANVPADVRGQHNTESNITGQTVPFGSVCNTKGKKKINKQSTTLKLYVIFGVGQVCAHTQIELRDAS